MFLGGHGAGWTATKLTDLSQSIARPWSICHHPSARFTRVITLKLRALHRKGCPGALSDACFKEPSAAPCRAVNHALAVQDARLAKARRPIQGAGTHWIMGCNCAAPKETLKRSHQRITLLSASVSASLGRRNRRNPAGAQGVEVYVVAVRKLSPWEPGIVDRCIAKPYAQSRSQSGAQIFQPHNPCAVTQRHEARNTAGSVDVTNKFATAGGLCSRRQPFIGGSPDQQLPRLQPPQGHRQSDEGDRSSIHAMWHQPPTQPHSPRQPD